MKKYLLLFLGITLLALSSTAQDCNETSIMQKTNIWKEGPKGSQGGTAADLTREKKVVEAIFTMIKSKYTPIGVEANFHGTYNGPDPNIPANGYSYSIIPLNYYCDGNTIKTAHETSTYFEIAANIFDAEIYNEAQGDRLLAEGYNVMADMPFEKDGYYYFKETDAGLGFGMTGKSSAWLITYDGKLPYRYVTKKEFLEKRKQSLTTQMHNSAAGIKDILKNIEIEKGYKEAEFKNDPERLKKYMKMDYLSIKDKYEKLLAENENLYKPEFDKIETQLKMPAAELDQPAIVKQNPNDHLSYLFTNDDDPFGKVLIQPNPGYFNTKIPRSSPQFFWIYVRANQKEPIAARFMADIMKAVDFAVLKNMLGK